MIEKYFNDESLKNYSKYIEFINNNPGKGYLKVRASAANEAIPISNINIKITKNIGNYRVIFYEGKTDYSGMINDIVLPSPRKIINDEVAPNFTDYNLHATGSSQNIDLNYTISICCGITVIQYINVTPKGLEYGY